MRSPVPTSSHSVDGDTPALRLFALLEVIASKDQLFSLQDLAEETGLPKPTLHRMLHQLENGGMLQRDAGSRHYGTGARLRRLAENLLLHDTLHGVRHAILRQLVDEVGETCNITALSGSEVLYLDRVETPAPLRFHLHPGSRVPSHCSASGKLLLAQMPPSQRRRLLENMPLHRYTARTITDQELFEQEVDRVKRDGYACDDEEFMPGLFCAAVLVPAAAGERSNTAIAVQAPAMRLSRGNVGDILAPLRRAALAMARIDAQAALGPTEKAHE